MYARGEPLANIDPSGEADYTITGLVVSMGIGAVIGAIAGYSAFRSFRGAAEGALQGAVVGASFYAAAPLAAPMLWRLSLAGTSAAGGGGSMVTLYRAMSTAECQAVLNTGQFSASGNSLGGKWFAESLPHAIQWGQKLEGTSFRVIQIQVRESAARLFMRLPMLDRIGPARYAELEELNQAVVSVKAVYP